MRAHTNVTKTLCWHTF